MSYYSDVKCVVKNEDWDLIKGELNQYKNELLNKYPNNEDIEFDFNRFFTYCDALFIGRTGMVVLSWKTYNHWGTDIVSKKFEDLLENSENEYNFNFIRIGEGAGCETDIETMSGYPDNFDEYEKYNIIRVEQKIVIE